MEVSAGSCALSGLGCDMQRGIFLLNVGASCVVCVSLNRPASSSIFDRVFDGRRQKLLPCLFRPAATLDTF